MVKKSFKIRAKLVFGGQVTVQAHDRKEAEAAVEQNVRALLGRVEAFSEDITDWDFCTHGDAVANRRKQQEEEDE